MISEILFASARQDKTQFAKRLARATTQLRRVLGIPTGKDPNATPFYVFFGKFDTVFLVDLPSQESAIKLVRRIADDDLFTNWLTVPTVPYGKQKEGDLDSQHDLPFLLLTFIQPDLYGLNQCSRLGVLKEVVKWCERSKFDVYLSLSASAHFPLILRSHHETLSSVQAFTQSLENIPYLLISSSMLALSSRFIWTNHNADRPDILGNEFLGGLEATIGIRLKYQPNDWRLIDRHLHQDLAKFSNRQEILNRTFFWDVFALITTENLTGLVDYIAHDLRTSSGKLIRPRLCGTIAYLPPTPPTALPPTRKKKKQRKRIRRGASKLIARRKRIPKGPYQHLLQESGSQLDLMILQLAQLRAAWLEKELASQDFFSNTVQIINRLIAAFNRTVATSIAINDDHMVWLQSELVGFHEILHILSSEYQVRTQGIQTLSSTEPFVQFGHQSGTLDAVMEAAGRIMSRYCGEWKLSSGAGFQRVWKGIVVNSNGHTEWCILPGYQILKIPVRAVELSKHRLVPLAHEGAHQILAACRDDETKSNHAVGKALFKLWSPILGVASRSLEEWENCVSEKLDKSSSIELKDKYLCAAQRSQNLLLRRRHARSLANDEVLVDILASLAAGPAFARSLFELFPSTHASSTHPMVWLRILLAALVFRSLTDEETYLELVEPWFDLDPKRADQMGLTATQEISILDISLHHARKITPQTKWVEEFLETDDLMSLDLMECGSQSWLHIIRAVIRSPDNVLVEIHKWCLNWSDDFLFFDWNDPHSKLRNHQVIRQNFKSSTIQEADIREILAATVTLDRSDPVSGVAASLACFWGW